MLNNGFDIQSLISFSVPEPSPVQPWFFCMPPHSSLPTTRLSPKQETHPRLLYCTSCMTNRSSICYHGDDVVILIYLTHIQISSCLQEINQHYVLFVWFWICHWIPGVSVFVVFFFFFLWNGVIGRILVISCVKGFKWYIYQEVSGRPDP